MSLPVNNFFNSSVWTGSGLWAMSNAAVSGAIGLATFCKEPIPANLSLFYMATPILGHLAYNSSIALSKTNAAAAVLQKSITFASNLIGAGLLAYDLVTNPGKGLFNLAMKTAGITGSLLGFAWVTAKTQLDAPKIVSDAKKAASTAYGEAKTLFQNLSNKFSYLIENGNVALQTPSIDNNTRILALENMIQRITREKLAIQAIGSKIDEQRHIVINSGFQIGLTGTSSVTRSQIEQQFTELETLRKKLLKSQTALERIETSLIQDKARSSSP